MSVGIWVRKTVALGLAATLFGPSVSMLSAQEAQSESQEDKKARKQQQQEAQQRKQAEREQQQAEKRAQRESQASKQQERAQQEQQQRQQQREERTNNQQQRQAEEQRARQDQRQAQEQQRVERQRAEQEQRARQAEQAQRDQSQRQQTDQAQRDLERRQRRSEQSRAEAQAQAEAQARAAEAQRQAQQAQQQREAAERAQQQRSQDDARYRQPQPGRDYGRDYGNGRNGRVITEQRRGEIIRENRERTEHFNQGWQQREHWGTQRAQELQRQRRYASYRYQQRYLNQLRLQWNNNDWRRYDYNRDPYFSVAPNYRYRYSGRYYEINDYGADLLRSAVNYGYEEGFLAGQADREDRWHGDYRESYAYEDASYGYRGLYVDQQQYSYYFRQGFDRGYADGYNARYEYGRRDNTGLKVLAGVLAGILVFEALD